MCDGPSSMPNDSCARLHEHCISSRAARMVNLMPDLRPAEIDTRVAFIVFTSNVFAIVGLRSFYFVLAGAIGRFRYLKAGLSVVLVFVGAKMLLDPHGREPKWFQFEISTVVSLLVVILILSTSITVSVLTRPERKSG